MDHLGRTLDNLHRGDTQIIEGDLKVGGDHIITGDLEAKQIETGQINPLPPASQIIINSDLDLNDNQILNVNKISNDAQGLVIIAGESGETDLSISVDEIRAIPPVISQAYLQCEGNGKTTLIDNDFNTFEAGSANIFNVDTGGGHGFSINNQSKFDITNSQLEARTKLVMVGANQIQCTNFTTDVSSNLNFLIDGETLNFRRFGAGLDIGWSDGDIVLDTNNLDMDNNDIKNVNNLQTKSINTNIVYVRTAADLPTAIGGFHNLEANKNYVIVGNVSLTNGIRFNTNNAIQGADFNSTLIFDESANDIIGFQSVDQNVYISQLTISGGGGHFANSVIGLFDCVDIDTGGSPPFYGRNKRFKITDVNIIAAYKLGRVQGFGTLNFNNNFVNGGGGAPTGVYTVDGLKVSDGLSLEFINNKMVLFQGAQIASTAIMLEFTANLTPPNAGFNAVNISSNIFHPRNNENAIKFNNGSTTQLGVISSNTFIRSGGTAALIDYPNQATFDNYNPECIETYTIDANVGISNSEPNVKAHFVNSQNISSTTYTDIPLITNSDFSPLQETARFGVELVVTGMITPGPDFVDFETITNINTGFTALVLKAEPRGIGVTEQTIYICDMTGAFDNGPIRNQAGTQTSGGCTINPTFCYGEKDPRKLSLQCALTIDGTGNQVFNAAPACSMGGGAFMVDTDCESRTLANSSGLGGTFSVTCQNIYNEGDKIKIQVKANTTGNFNVLNYVLTIK